MTGTKFAALFHSLYVHHAFVAVSMETFYYDRYGLDFQYKYAYSVYLEKIAPEDPLKIGSQSELIFL
ncbi:hypothetical protein RM549_00875 [Salegentibacter sp. F188]|uniref:Uncharacterized protein n=1 Tax=Autumnicola patrickiae TaxID=3075591 RepID=A0ABU3DX77_9FLAO|nr:hypothetical protein [Salegentibacter sp. F188]MDT0688321.1 hypothetical protein [Salegentibacter sp. F188]